jgi:hypothetical protein
MTWETMLTYLAIAYAVIGMVIALASFLVMVSEGETNAEAGCMSIAIGFVWPFVLGKFFRLAR